MSHTTLATSARSNKKLELSLDDITVDNEIQARVALDEPTLNDYAELWRVNTEFPPVVVYFDGERYLLADGFHRVESARRSGIPSISADVRKGDRRAAILYAAGANAKHGLRRSTADKQRAVETILRDDEWVQWSDRQLAKLCNVDHKTIAAIRTQLVANGEIPNIKVRKTADGKKRSAKAGSTSNASPVEVARLSIVDTSLDSQSYLLEGHTSSEPSHPASSNDGEPNNSHVPEMLASKLPIRSGVGHDVVPELAVPIIELLLRQPDDMSDEIQQWLNTEYAANYPTLRLLVVVCSSCLSAVSDVSRASTAELAHES